MKFLTRGLLAAALTTSLAFAAAPAKAADDIVDTAVKAGTFKTLAQALTAADLIKTLKGTGPFTVFAPTDEAFAKLPKETLDALLKPENKKQLTSVLLYHVISGKAVKSDRITKAKNFSVKMANNGYNEVDTKNGVTIGKAKVTKADIEASNGVIHVIDTVLVPKTVSARLAFASAATKVKAATGAAVEKAKEVGGKAMDAAKSGVDKAKDAMTPKPAEPAPAKK